MKELFSYQDFITMGNEDADLKNSKSSLKDDLETWGIDPKGFQQLVNEFTALGLVDMLFRRKSPDDVLDTSFIGGFILGFKTSLELETRRVVNDEGRG